MTGVFNPERLRIGNNAETPRQITQEEFDAQIQAIQDNPNLSEVEKRTQIGTLQLNPPTTSTANDGRVPALTDPGKVLREELNRISLQPRPTFDQEAFDNRADDFMPDPNEPGRFIKRGSDEGIRLWGEIGSLVGEQQFTSGIEGREFSRENTDPQLQATRESIAEIRAAREEGRELLEPFRQLGLDQAGEIGQDIGNIRAPGSLGDLASLQGVNAPGDLSGLARQGLTAGQAGAQQLGGAVSDIQGLDPNVLNSPFFQALQDEGTRNLEQSAAARGKVGAGETRAAIAKQSLLLGNQFGQQDLQNRLTTQGQRFGQLQGALGFGQQAQSQGFGQISDAQQTNLANQLDIGGQRFGQLSQSQQQDLLNQLTLNQSEFGQRLNLLNIGQASAAGTAAGAQQAGQDIGSLLSAGGDVQAAQQIAEQNRASQRRADSAARRDRNIGTGISIIAGLG